VATLTPALPASCCGYEHSWNMWLCSLSPKLYTSPHIPGRFLEILGVLISLLMADRNFW